MRCIIISLFCLCSTSSFSQIIKINNGFSASSMKKVLTEKIVAFSSSIGVDYFEHKYYYLSSEVAYMKLGGENSDALYGAVSIKARESWDCLQFNTTFRARYPIGQFHFYVGVGPKFDLIINNNKFSSLLYKNIDGLKMLRVTFGGKLESGIAYDLGKTRIGLNVSYLFPIGKSARDFKSGFLGETYLHNKTMAYYLSFGIRL